MSNFLKPTGGTSPMPMTVYVATDVDGFILERGDFIERVNDPLHNIMVVAAVNAGGYVLAVEQRKSADDGRTAELILGYKVKLVSVKADIIGERVWIPKSK